MADTTNDSGSKRGSKNFGRPLPKPNRTSGADHVAEQAAVKNPDAVQEGIIRFWGWVEDNAKYLALGLLVLLLAGIAQVVTRGYWDRQEKKAQAAYFPLEAKYKKLKEGFDRAKFKNLTPPGAKPDDKPDTPATGDLQKDYGSAITDLEKFAHDHQGTTAAGQAALIAAGTYLDYKQPDKALELAELPVKHLSASNVLSPLSQLLVGSAQATKGDCAAATKTWQGLLDDSKALFLHGEAGLRSGLCFESMNQPDKAMELYRKVATAGAQSTTGTTAKGLLRALEVKSGKTTSQPSTVKAN